MKKGHWITLLLLIWTVIVACSRLTTSAPQYEYGIHKLLIFLFSLLPLIIFFRNKVAIWIWSMGLILYGLLHSVNIINPDLLPLSFEWDWYLYSDFTAYFMVWNAELGDYITANYSSLSFLYYICFFAESASCLTFGIIATIGLYKPVKSWLIYVLPLICFGVNLVWQGASQGYIVCNYFDSWHIVQYFDSVILAISTYFMTHKKPGKIDFKHTANSISNTARNLTEKVSNEESGFSYLDEYKRNMKK